MRRLILVAVGLVAVGVAVYRQRSIDRCEQELAIGGHTTDGREGAARVDVFVDG
jgi:hypothetical protein